MNISRLKFPLLTIGAGLLLGLMGDLLFYNNPPGISVPIFTVALTVALLALAFVERASIIWANQWLLVPLLLMSTMSAVRAAPLLRFLNISGVLALLALQAYGLLTRPLVDLNVGGYLLALFETGISAFLLTPIPLLKRGTKALEAYEGSGKVIRRILVGLLIALPLLIVFTALFASADPIFQELVEDAFSTDLIGHTLLTLALAWTAMGGLTYALSRSRGEPSIFSSAPRSVPEASDGQDETAGPSESAQDSNAEAAKPSFNVRELLGALEATVALFSVDVLFLVFVAIQFVALFGGEAFLRRHELTYSEYARRGFFELLTVSLITLGLILVLDFITHRKRGVHHVTFLIGSGLMIALTIIILGSAYQRLRLYELAYGFTRLRLYTHVFMPWLAVLLAALLAMLIVRRTRPFATAALVVALGFTITLDVLNPDALISQRNVERYYRGEELDVDYLGSLSADAVPGLLWLLENAEPEIGAQAGPWLHHHLDRLDRRQARAGWPSYHYSVDRAHRLLDQKRDQIEAFELPAHGSRYE